MSHFFRPNLQEQGDKDSQVKMARPLRREQLVSVSALTTTTKEENALFALEITKKQTA